MPGVVNTLGQHQRDRGLTGIARQHWICRGHPLQQVKLLLDEVQVIYKEPLEVSGFPLHRPLDRLPLGHCLESLYDNTDSISVALVDTGHHPRSDHVKHEGGHMTVY